MCARREVHQLYTLSAAVAYVTLCGAIKAKNTMAAWSWLLLLCLAGVLQARAELDTTGFVSIDCGLPETTASYVDDTTGLSYLSDADFIDAGSNHNISGGGGGNTTPRLSKQYINLRSFPDGERNCYTLRSLVAGHKYLFRAIFMYGNYDGLNRPPIFDLYVGANLWTTVNVTIGPSVELYYEIVTVVPDDFAQVCLVNTGAGTPFISGLDLRPVRNSFYPDANATQGLSIIDRYNFGGDAIIRYPDDPLDRVWVPWPVDARNKISTTETVRHVDNNLFEVPSKVMQTAATPSARDFWVSWDLSLVDPRRNKDPFATPSYTVILHLAELQRLPKNAVREFEVYHNGILWSDAYTPTYLLANALYGTIAFNSQGTDDRFNISLNATANSTLAPIINAVEFYSVVSTTDVGTDSQDVSAITAIKAMYKVHKNWMGDPCLPKNLAWNGLNCSYAISSPPTITDLNLSFSGLSGDISSSFANLKAIKYLDLSYNNLTGSIPDTLSQLHSLKYLDLTGNQLNGSIPSGLLKRIQDGSLTIKYGNNPNLCTNADSCKSKTTKGSSKLAIYIAVAVVLVVVVVSVVVLLIYFLRKKKRGPPNNVVKPINEKSSISHVSTDDPAYTPSSMKLENRRFTYKELEMITRNFSQVLGQGGFGYVYDGFLEDGTQVAVKLRSDSSNQGVKEFLAEAQILTRIHHTNLVSIIGYCKDGEYMALVYEFMSEGTLQEHIAGNGHNRNFLTWRQRLKIALESAQGLDYLHKGCNPPLIHRDVKASNILLNSKLEAKIADFGLSKAFNRDNDTHISTNVIVGTPGYVDPEYHRTMQPTTKSDVYSFGVVLLELITGRPAIFRDPEPTSIVKWTQLRLAKGNIESVVDPRMHGAYDVNSVWKVADIALKCTAMESVQRPTMSEVVAQLQDCLELENGHGSSANVNHGFYTSSSSNQHLGYNTYTTDGQSIDASQSSSSFEVEHNFARIPTMAAGPVAR